MIRRIWKKLAALRHTRRFERELAEEIEFHRALKLEETGDPAAAARAMGNETRAREDSREAWMFTPVESVARDLRHAARVLGRSPIFTACAVVSLALGIGANAAIFTLTDALLLRAMPVSDPGRIVKLMIHSDEPMTSFAYPLFEDVKARCKSITGLFTWSSAEFSTGWGPDAATLHAAVASGDMYTTLGLHAQVGRLFTSADDQTGKPLVAVLSDAYWERAYQRDPNVVGRSISLDRTPFTIVGVTPRDFLGIAAGSRPDITIPIHANAALHPQWNVLESKTSWYLTVLGRLAPSVTLEEARAELAAISPRVMLDQTDPTARADHRKRDLAQRLDAVPGASGSSWLAQRYRSALLVLMAISGLVLVATCANLASLSLARASARQKELSIRLALGSGRLRIARQLLSENAILAVAGTALGMLLSFWATRTLVAFLSPHNSPIILNLSLDTRALTFLALLAIAACILSGFAPALQGTDLQPNDALKQTSIGNARRGRFRLGKFLVTVQIALSAVVLAGAFLFVQTLQNLRAQPIGFHPANLLFVSLEDGPGRLDKQQAPAFRAAVLEKVRALPFIQSASSTNIIPISGSAEWQELNPADWPKLNPAQLNLYVHRVSTDYFRTVGSALLAGHDFTRSDDLAAASATGIDAKPAGDTPIILNASAARTYFPAGSALGRTLKVESKSYRVIGIAADAKYMDLRQEAPATAYLPAGTHSYLGNLILRTDVDSQATLSAIRRILRELGKDVSIGETISLTHQIDESLVTERLIAILASLFAALAAILVAIGLYGVVAYTSARRTSEIGLRLAIGATRRDVLWMVLRDGLRMAVVGVLIGVPAAALGSRAISKMLYGVRSGDPMTLAGTVLLLIMVAVAAALIPAWRASKLDPLKALRYE